MLEPSASENSPRRKAISKRVRFEILRRDDYTCKYCRSTENSLTIDHVVPVVLGGTDDPSNLVAACRECNAGKTSSVPDASLVAQANDDAVRWCAAMQVAAGKMRDDLQGEWDYAQALDDEWSGWTYGHQKHPVPRPGSWRNSANAWRLAGLPIDLLIDAARRALGNEKIPPHDTWKYFCGIAWKRITQIQKSARDVVSPAEPVDAEVDVKTYSQGWDDGTDYTFAIPSINYGNLMFRALSRAVDGPSPWNRRAVMGDA